MEAYCVKCDKKVEMSNEQPFTMKNGRSAVKGNCPGCNRVVCRILGMANKGPAGGCGC